MKNAKEMTITELKKAAAEYKAEMLEGGEGYNPYAEELASDERTAESRRLILDKFLTEWTREITAARRAEFNTFVRSISVGGRVENAKIVKFEDEKGWNRIDLKKAVDYYENN